ncbi:MAG TPA: sugar phosphate nucleotidyltransferase [Candidatus Omnitrophota bacterium]|nr:sugar phosphate nucleotidyltransferase [Candidatus Omnitrophota bacterium]
MKAIVLAGGLGTRLHPLTINIPKPMIPVVNRPLMEYTIELLAKYGFKDVSVLLYHQPHIIRNHFGDGHKFGVKINYVEAPKNYGTAGAVKYASRNMNERFLVISADLVTDFDLKKINNFHESKKAALTIVLTRVANPLPYGIVICDRNGRIKHFLEKPSWSEVFSDTINTGIYMIEPEVLREIPDEKEFDFSQDFFPRLMEKKEKLFGYVAEGLWKDIGNIEEYGRVHEQIMADVPVIKGKNCVIAKSARLEGTGAVGDNTAIADDAVVINSIIGNNCKIGRGSYIREAIIWDNCELGSEVRMERSILGKGSQLGDRVYLEENSVVADEVRIGRDAVVRPHVKVWPGKVIEEGSTVSRSMVQRERYPKTIFGPFGVTGICNVELTPEFAANLGAAYGAMLGQGCVVTASRDSHKASRMIYRALLSGALSAGVSVSDLEMTPIPVTRYELKALKSKGGFHVRKSPYDPEVIDIKFFDDNGLDLDSAKEKKVERMFFAEDFKRLRAEEVGELNFPFHRVAEQYKEGVIHHVDLDAIRNRKCKIVVDYAWGAASQIFPSILGELDCEVVALNAYIDETKVTKTKEQFEHALQQMSMIVKTLDADLGVMLDAGAEKIFICDEKGRIYSGDEALSLLATLIFTSRKNATVAVPINTSSSIDVLAARYGGKVMRTKTSFRHMMDIASRPEIAFVGERLGGFIFPDFQPHFDGMFSIVKLMELLKKNGVKISEIDIPRSNIFKKDISCLPELKGKVIRTLAEELKEEEVELVDGIKLHLGGDWILVLPHPTRPVIELFAECAKEKDARRLLSEYTKKIDEILQ